MQTLKLGILNEAYHSIYCKFCEGLFRKTSLRRRQSSTKLKSMQSGEITLSFTDVGKSCSSRQFLTSQIIRESPPQLENRIMAQVYVRSITRSTMYQKARFCLQEPARGK